MKNVKKLNNLFELLLRIKQKITASKQTSFTMLCIKILNQKLKKYGILKQKQSILTKIFSIKDFTDRKLFKIIQDKIKNLDSSLILKLFREKKILLKKKPVKSLNLFLDIESENFLKIKI